MTTLHAFEGKPNLCLPQPEQYRLFFILLSIFCWSHSLVYANADDLKEAPTAFVSLDTLRTDAVVHISTDTIPDTVIISDCDLNIRFQSDRSYGLLYKDSINSPRNSIITFCPPNGNSHLTFNFNSFGLDEGDTLYVYDGLVDHAMLAMLGGSPGATPPPTGTGSSAGSGATPAFSDLFIASGSGYGSATFNGGWVAADCDRTTNPSGCITFHFKTDGDGNKDIGWDASIACTDRATTLRPPGNQFINLECADMKGSVTIGAGRVNSICTVANDSILVKVINGAGKVCKDTCLDARETFPIDLAIGTYTVQYFLKADPAIKAERYVAISPPVMVCNDNVNVSLGAACSATILPDMLLENPCDPIGNNLYYNIIVTDTKGDTLAKGTSKNDKYPWVLKDKVDICGDTRYQVEITRVYDYGDACCSQGKVEDVCWGYMTFTDETGPAFYESKTQTVKACDVSLENLNRILTKPNVIDNCDNAREKATVQLSEIELIEGKDCDSVRTYIATWRATDKCGNRGSQRDTVKVLRPTIVDFVDLPDIMLRCGIDEEQVINDIRQTGIPRLAINKDTIELNTEEYICGFILLKEDKYFPHPGGVKLFRYWSISNQCAPRPIPIQIDTQLIEYLDTLVPVLFCPPHNTLADAERIPVRAIDCMQKTFFDDPVAVDLCDPNPTVQMIALEQRVDGKWDSIAPNLTVTGFLPADTFRVKWHAYDGSGNFAQETCYRYFIFEDETIPSAICKDELHVSFGQGTPTLTVDEIDDISWDACGITKREVRRTDEGTWRNQVAFGCEDVYENPRVELRITDVMGNQNVCWLYVQVLDNVRPICERLPDTLAYCDQFFTNELGEPTDTDGDAQFEGREWQPLTGDLLKLYNDRFGYPECYDNANCRILSLEQEYQLIYDQCGSAKAQRRYRAFDGRQPEEVSPWLVQIITVDYRPDWKFNLPLDWKGECGDDLPAPAFDITKGSCDILAWEYEDQVFDIVNDACFQINRTYYIINWCLYQPGMAPYEINRSQNLLGDVVDERSVTPATYGNFGYFKYTQVLKVNDNSSPIVSINPVETCIYGAGDLFPIGEEDLTPGASPYECDTIRVFSAEASDCESAFFKNFSFEYWISEDGVQTGHGEANKFFWTVQPKVKYQVKFRVYDNCGNFGEKEEIFQFWDCTRPTIICQDTLATNIRIDGTALVSPAVIASRSYDNCTPQEYLDYRVWHDTYTTEAPSTTEAINTLPSALELSCEYQGIQTVRVYILDAEDNYSSCTTHIIITDEGEQCEETVVRPRVAVAGKIVMENGVEVEEVEVQVTGDGTMPSPYETTTDGNYNFRLTNGQVYNVVPKKNIRPLNGVSTFDLVLISKHILGIEHLDSPYHQIAADINNSKTITAYDLVQLRQLILNITTEFPANESWRFVDASYQFTTDTPLNEPYKEFIEVALAGADKMDNNFIAIKTGDVSGNAAPNGLVVSEARSTATFPIQVQDRMVKVGEEITVHFQAETLQELEGYQFALAYKGLELMTMEEGIVEKQHIGWTMKERQILPISWNKNHQASNEITTDQLFALTFKAQTSGKLSDLLSIHPTFMQVEAYTAANELMKVELQFATKNTPFELLQNRPNPFKDQTSIGFYLPIAGTVHLTILTTDGKKIHEWTNHFESGQQEWLINSQALAERGVLYYQLKTDQSIQTKKMIVLE